MPPFLKSKFRCLPPLPARRACHGSTWYDCKASQVCGRFLPHQRASNVDQVPLPFVNDMKETLDEKGADRVTINQNGPALWPVWPGERVGASHACSVTVRSVYVAGFLGPRGGTPRFLNDFWLTSRQYFLMWRFLNAHEPLYVSSRRRGGRPARSARGRSTLTTTRRLAAY